MSFTFSNTDTINHQFTSYEDMLVNAYNRDNFLFAPSKTDPDLMTFFVPRELTGNNYDILKKQYPKLAKFDFRKILWLYRMDGYNDMGMSKNVSAWLILPDNTSFLLSYTGKIIKDEHQKFIDILKPWNGAQKNVCIVFDKSGKQIAGNDDPVLLKDN